MDGKLTQTKTQERYKMKLEVEFKDSEYIITLNNKKVFNWKNHRRILREIRDILDRHDMLLRYNRIKK